jgi:hypothetical protein
MAFREKIFRASTASLGVAGRIVQEEANDSGWSSAAAAAAVAVDRGGCFLCCGTVSALHLLALGKEREIMKQIFSGSISGMGSSGTSAS